MIKGFINKMFGRILEYLYINNYINKELIHEILCKKCKNVNNCNLRDNIPWCFEDA